MFHIHWQYSIIFMNDRQKSSDQLFFWHMSDSWNLIRRFDAPVPRDILRGYSLLTHHSRRSSHPLVHHASSPARPVVSGREGQDPQSSPWLSIQIKMVIRDLDDLGVPPWLRKPPHQWCQEGDVKICQNEKSCCERIAQSISCQKSVQVPEIYWRLHMDWWNGHPAKLRDFRPARAISRACNPFRRDLMSGLIPRILGHNICTYGVFLKRRYPQNAGWLSSWNISSINGWQLGVYTPMT